MILHLLTDGHFSDYVIKQFSLDNHTSEFIVIPSNNSINAVKYINSATVVYPNTESFNQLLLQLDKYSAIVFHGMFFPWQEQILKNVPSRVKLCWMFWGGEIYERKDLYIRYYSLRSKIIFKTHNLVKLFKHKQIGERYEVPIKQFRKVEYCLTDMQQDYEFAKKYLQNNMQMLWYNYYSIEDTVGVDLMNKQCNGTGIFIGNSATITNNHVDAFKLVSKLDKVDRNIVVPLSYGSIWYKNFIVKIWKLYFKKDFIPITTYIERSKYNELMLSCNVMIMPHYRAQAQGNIITGLWLGMRVYLYKRNFAYQYFKQLGLIIYSIDDDLNKKNVNVCAQMPIQDILHNRNILMKVYGKDAMTVAVKNVIKELTKNINENIKI